MILCGAGEYGRKALEKLDTSEVVCFLDSNESLYNQYVNSIVVKPYDYLDELDIDCDIIITVSRKYINEIKEILKGKRLSFFESIEQYLIEQSFSPERWKKYKDIHEGESCFLVGSGPSLRLSDLERLANKNIVTFAPNKIFKVFDDTSWRPDYYVVTDRRIIDFYGDTIASLALNNKMLAYYTDKQLEVFYKKCNIEKDLLFRMKDNDYEKGVQFSIAPDEYIIEGRTVMYAMMQIAAYMGFKKMYLIGVDFSYSDQSGYDKNGNDHFCKDYIEDGEVVLITPREYAVKTFEGAKKNAEQLGFEIYNATRGGKLEVFKRVDVEKVIAGV